MADIYTTVVSLLPFIVRVWEHYANQERPIWRRIVITELVLLRLFFVISVFWKLQFGYTPIHVLCNWLSD